MFLECANHEITAILKFQEKVWFMLLCVSFYGRCYYVRIPVICSWIWINNHVGRARSSVCNWEGRDQSPSHEEPMTASSSLAPTGRPNSSVCLKQAINLFLLYVLVLHFLTPKGCKYVGLLSLKILVLTLLSDFIYHGSWWLLLSHWFLCMHHGPMTQPFLQSYSCPRPSLHLSLVPIWNPVEFQ